MPIPTFDPTVPPSPGTSDKPEIKKLVAEFGDGYSQAVPDGINHIRRELSLDWDLLTPTQAVDILDFFRDLKGCEPFYYTPSDEVTALKWICDDWADTRSEAGFRKVSVKFKQSFLL